ncbi:prepilin peptidase [Naumannella halotolerans]|uniref:Leader peptidase (Prepilin peptidase)/N-methyltransferase n=1 Tax=Naumannella halotolerans TaxID=993414 RepID=A0A4R7J262_9ACTN|nr:A24 family peptidase [Naumannella halotolerans]TDT31272.1 leader peptidase (prepilin peptidase)/N-methyltransferase [Naumannella halotolerans]
MGVALICGLIAGIAGIGSVLLLRPRHYVHEGSEQHRKIPLWPLPLATAWGGFATALLGGDNWTVTGLLVAAWIWGMSLVVIDIEVHRLPDRIVLPAYPVVIAVLAVAAGTDGEWWPFWRAMICMVAALVGYFLLAVVGSGSAGLGLGDVKLAGVLGALLGWFGWTAALVGLLAGFVLGGLVAIILLITGRAGRRDHLPLGPAMILGAAVVWTLPLV